MKLYPAKGFALRSLTILVLAAGLASCTKQASNDRRGPSGPDVEVFPIENSKFKNCHFKNPNPSYTFGSTIEPNPIMCDEGVPKKVEILTPAPLPSGITFSPGLLNLSGTANERVVQAPYDFYIENEAGYAIIKIQISIQ